jgi:hypothetical protein
VCKISIIVTAIVLRVPPPPSLQVEARRSELVERVSEVDDEVSHMSESESE